MKKEILKNIISGLINQFTSIIYGFIVPILIINTYGSNVNGLISSITQFIAYISLLQIGIGPVIKNALFEPIAKNDKEKVAIILGASNNFFRKIAYILIGYIIVLCVIYPFINTEFSKIFSISLILIISIGTFFEYFFGMTYKLFLTSCQKNYVVDIINTIGYVVSVIIIYVLIRNDSSIQIVKMFGALIFIVKPILLKLYFDKKFGIKIKDKSTYNFEKKWDGFAHHIAATVQGNTDIVILTIFDSLKNVSVYSVYNLIITGVRNVIVSLTNGLDGYFGNLIIKDSTKINDRFYIYNLFYYTISTIVIACTMVLITPFVGVYTKNIVDANYFQPVFGYILVFAEFNYIIRYPFATLVYSKGNFKETTKYAIFEPIVNIIISIILAKKYGIVGVAIGTLVSMPIRSFGFIYYSIKYILKEKMFKYTSIILLSFIELLFIFIMRKYLIFVEINNYLTWFISALITLVMVSFFIIIMNVIIYRIVLRKNKGDVII